MIDLTANSTGATSPVHHLSLHNYLLEQPEAATKIHVRRVEKAASIYEPGDLQTHIHLLEAGIVKIGSYSPDGGRAIYDVLQPGEFFGDLNYLDEVSEFFEFAKAVTSLTLLSIEQAFFKHLIVHDTVVSEWFNKSVVRRWWKAETRLLCMTGGAVDARLDNLRNEYDKPVRDADGRLRNTFSLLSLQSLADLTGASRQTIAKKLKSNS